MSSNVETNSILLGSESIDYREMLAKQHWFDCDKKNKKKIKYFETVGEVKINRKCIIFHNENRYFHHANAVIHKI